MSDSQDRLQAASYSANLKPGQGREPTLEQKIALAQKTLAAGHFRRVEVMFKALMFEGDQRLDTRLNCGVALLGQARWWEGAITTYLALRDWPEESREGVARRLVTQLASWAKGLPAQGLAADALDGQTIAQAFQPFPGTPLAFAARWLPNLSNLSRFDALRDFVSWFRLSGWAYPLDAEALRLLAGSMLKTPQASVLVPQLADGLMMALGDQDPEPYREVWLHILWTTASVAGEHKREREFLGLMLNDAFSSRCQPKLQKQFMDEFSRGMAEHPVIHPEAMDAYRALLERLHPGSIQVTPCEEAGIRYTLYDIPRGQAYLRECLETGQAQSLLAQTGTSEQELMLLVDKLGGLAYIAASHSDRLADKQAFDRDWMAPLAERIGAEAEAQGFRPLPPPGPRPEGRPLRIGYLTCTPYTHSVGLLARNFLSHHTPAVEARLYATTQLPKKDDVTLEIARRVAGFHWQRVYGAATARQMADLIRGHDIDVLIDLDSGTSLYHALVHYHRPARVAAAMLGWDAPGMPFIDHYLVDPYLLPEQAQDYYVERLVRLPRCAFLGAGLETRPDPARREELRAELGIAPDQVAYLIAAPGRKITLETAEAACRVLRELPNGLLLVKGKGHPAYIQGFWRDRAQALGIDPQRIRFPPYTPDRAGHHAQLTAADVVLDTYPATGGMHSMENLWLGNPLVTQYGETFLSRISYSMLHSIGMGELCAETRDQYVRIAVALGADPQARASVRARLRGTLQQGLGLWDVAGLMRDLEHACEGMLNNPSGRA